MEDMVKKSVNKKVLVTGCTGYIGSRLVRELLNLGYSVRGLVQDDENNRVIAQELEQLGMEKWIGDLTDADSLKGIGSDVSILIHLAGLHSSLNKMADLYISGTQNVLNELNGHDIEKIIYSSSGAVYGDHGDELLTEDCELIADHPFGQVSLKAENKILEFGQKWKNAEIIIFRIGEVYGPGIYDPFNRISFQGLSAYGDGEDYSSYIGIEDVINIYLLAIKKKINGIYNLVDDMPIPRRRFYEEISELSGDIPIKWINVDNMPERILLSIHGLRMMSIRMSNEQIKKDLEYQFVYKDCFTGMRKLYNSKG